MPRCTAHLEGVNGLHMNASHSVVVRVGRLLLQLQRGDNSERGMRLYFLKLQGSREALRFSIDSSA